MKFDVDYKNLKQNIQKLLKSQGDNLPLVVKKMGELGEKQLEVLTSMLVHNSQNIEELTEDIGISKPALQKRLGEIYNKFEIGIQGPGKFVELQHILSDNYTEIKERLLNLLSEKTDVKVTSSNPSVVESKEKVDVETPKPNRKFDFSAIDPNLLYMFALEKETIDLSCIENNILPHCHYEYILQMILKMLEENIIIKVSGVAQAFKINPEAKAKVLEELNLNIENIIKNIEGFKISDIYDALKISSKNSDEKNISECILEVFCHFFRRGGLELYRQGDLNKAKSYFELGLFFNQTCWDLHYYIGNIYETSGKWDLALTSYKQSLKQSHEENYLPLINLTALKILKGNVLEVREVLEKAIGGIEQTNTNAELLSHLAMTYSLTKNYQEAKRYCTLALEIDPHTTIANYIMATMLELQPETKPLEIIDYWQNCLKEDVGEEDLSRLSPSHLTLYAKMHAKIAIEIIYSKQQNGV